MKKIWQLIPVLIFLSAASIGRADNLNIGFKLSYDHDRFTRPYLSDDLLAWQIDLFAGQKMSDFHALRFEIGYLHRQKQSMDLSYEGAPDGGFWHPEWRPASYVNLAALTKLFPPGRSRLIPYVEIGCSWSVLVAGGKVVALPPEIAADHNYHSDDYDLGYFIGGGFDIDPDGAGLSADLRFINELTPSTYAGDKGKNDYFSVSIAMKFMSLPGPL